MRTCIAVFALGFLAIAYCIGTADDKVKKATPPSPPGDAASRPTQKTEKSTQKTEKSTGIKIPATRDPRDDAAGRSEAGDDSPDDAKTAAVKFPKEEAEVLKTAEAYIQAYAKRDARGVAALFATDAEYVDAEGRVFQGREEIEKALEQCFKNHPQCRLELDISSIRFLSPALAIEDGTTVWSAGPEGQTAQESRYTAIHAKADGQWQVASVRENSADSPSQRAARLHQLHWLIGNWIDEDDDSVVHFDCRPSDDGNFLIRDFEVSLAGEKVLNGTQRIGWDPIAGRLRAWTFDSQGGFFEGYWHRDGDAWILSSNGVTADGKTASGRAIFSRVDDHTMTWQAVDREIDGARLEDSEEFPLVRRGPMPE